MIKSFILDPDGSVRPCEEVYDTIRVVLPQRTQIEPLPVSPFSRADRRRRARRGLHGRRGARRVPAPTLHPKPLASFLAEFVVYRRHYFRDARGEVGLFLPDGVEVTTDHIALADHLLSGVPAAALHPRM